MCVRVGRRTDEDEGEGEDEGVDEDEDEDAAAARAELAIDHVDRGRARIIAAEALKLAEEEGARRIPIGRTLRVRTLRIPIELQ